MVTLKSVLAPFLQAALLWLAGFRDACCIHRVYFFCRRSHKVFVKTGQCFLLNGCIFLGSILFFQRVVIPTLHWLLMLQVEEQTNGFGQSFLGALQKILISICYVFWLYPLYLISFVINCIWYNEIAQQAFAVLEQNNPPSLLKEQQTVKVSKSHQRQPGQIKNGAQSVLLSIGEQIYSVIMLSIFFVQVFAVSFIPHIGQYINFILLSWLYAYYCFDYKWGFAHWNLERRLLFFETNWAFFAGFGSPCVLASFFLTPFVSYGVMAILFPLFVLVATASHPEDVVASYSVGKDYHPQLARLPVFYLANVVMLPILRLLQGGAKFLSSQTAKTN